MPKLKMHSPDLTAANIDKLAALFPNCVTESRDENGQLRKSIDFDLLRQELSGDIVEGPVERYTINWPGKREAIVAANTPVYKTLRPCEAESVNFDTTRNLYIEGDNLEVLKLLQETYLGKVKMIYIDPPYNTGNDFIYDDDFAADIETELLKSSQKDASGGRLVANQESNGRFHSDWLSMMYPRLKLAWVLLKYDGVIFISIDDNEVHNLRKMCDEVLSKANFIAEFPRVTKKAGKSADIVSKNHDYVLAYRKTDQARLTSYAHVDSGFKHSDEHIETRGTYKLNQTLDYGSIQYSPSLDYEIKIGEIILRPGNVSQEEMEERKQRNPKSAFCWRWSRDLYQFGLANDFIVLKESRNGYRIYTKTYKNATIDRINGEYKVVVESRTKTPTTLDFIENKYSNDNSRKDMANLFDLKIFEYAKPVEIPMSLSFLSTEQNDIILDFFSGSATTAHAVMQLNAEDGGNRRFIMVQLPEVCDEKSEAFKAGYKTICEIGKERIRRAGREIKEENATNAPNLDVGFRVFKLDSSNMKDVYYTPDALDQKKLDLFADAIKEDRTAEDLLFQVFLDSGLDLALPVTKEKIDGKTIFTVDQNVLVACFASDIPESLIRTLAKRKPLKAVFLDRSFAKDSTKLNVTQIFKQLAPGTEVKTI